MIQYRINVIFWEMNQDKGYRKIHVYSGSNCIAVFQSVLIENKWTPHMIPMGFSFDESTYQDLVDISVNIGSVFELISRNELTIEEVQDFLNKL